MTINNNFDKKTTLTCGVLGQPSRIMGLTRVLTAILFFALFYNSIQVYGATVPTGQSVTLTWNPNTEPNIAGYNVYYGGASGTYTNMVTVSNVTNATISGLLAGVTYYFAVTAYNSLGQESVYSGEVSYSVVGLPTVPTVQCCSAPAGQFSLTVAGVTGHTYQIQATQDLTNWTVIGSVTLGTGGSLNFTDTNAANFSRRFYRTYDTQP
jgi:Fibronectin type III domain